MFVFETYKCNVPTVTPSTGAASKSRVELVNTCVDPNCALAQLANDAHEHQTLHNVANFTDSVRSRRRNRWRPRSAGRFDEEVANRCDDPNCGCHAFDAPIELCNLRSRQSNDKCRLAARHIGQHDHYGERWWDPQPSEDKLHQALMAEMAQGDGHGYLVKHLMEIYGPDSLKTAEELGLIEMAIVGRRNNHMAWFVEALDE